MNNKKTLVIGASTNPERTSFNAVRLLRSYNHDIIALGRKEGEIDEVKIETEQLLFDDIHTVTVYIRKELQDQIENYVFSLKPKRVIFNPGSENPSFSNKLRQENISVENACTLVLLKTNQY